MRLKFTFCLFLLALVSFSARSKDKQVLSTQNFAGWYTLSNRSISADGMWVLYERNQQKGNKSLIVYNTAEQENDTLKLASKAKFSPASDFVVYTLSADYEYLRSLKRKKTAKDKMPKDTLCVLSLKDGVRTQLGAVESYKLAERGRGVIAYLKKHKSATKAVKDSTVKADNVVDELNKELEKPKSKKNKKKTKTYNKLLVYQQNSKEEVVFNYVTNYAVSYYGDVIVFSTHYPDSSKISEVKLYDVAKNKVYPLFVDSGEVASLVVDRSGEQVSFLFSSDTIKNKKYRLFLSDGKRIAEPLNLKDAFTQRSLNPSKNKKVSFSRNGKQIYFGVNKYPVEEKNDSILKEDIPGLDVWSWTDLNLQPMQLKNLRKEKEATHLCVYSISKEKTVQLGDSICDNVKPLDWGNADYAIATNSKAYDLASSWNGKWVQDYYLISYESGKKEKILDAVSQAHFLPDGSGVLWYSVTDSAYMFKARKSGEVFNLTAHLDVNFDDEENDLPNPAYPYGFAGFSKNLEYALVYDRYDVWKLNLKEPNKSVNLSGFYGRKTSTRYRYISLDKEEKEIPLKNKMYLSTFNTDIYSTGFALLASAKRSAIPKALLKKEALVRDLVKAQGCDKVVFSQQTVSEYPNVYLSDLSFDVATQISDANPQQSQFNWASVELVKWKSFSGDSLRGLLYKPENFDASKKYPVLCYFYEKSSDRFHSHYTPYPSHSIINKTFYASNGYLVFVPDVVYETGYPGRSAYNCIVSGVEHLKKNYSFVDKDHIGLQGQSWGGYQTAYLITQTNQFAAAMAGAPVSNMTSAYGGIRWGSGMSRMFQYEHTQSRIGATLWDKLDLYLENSPIFHVPNIETPLLIMHNDKDGAVPWYQGIEMFVAMRRLQKPAWMLTYNGVDHNISSKYWANRMDLSNRMLGFFNHYLKGDKMPMWMQNGVPAIEKGKPYLYD